MTCDDSFFAALKLGKCVVFLKQMVYNEMVPYFIPVSVSGWHPLDAIAALRAEGHGQATKAALKLMTSGPLSEE